MGLRARYWAEYTLGDGEVIVSKLDGFIHGEDVEHIKHRLKCETIPWLQQKGSNIKDYYAVIEEFETGYGWTELEYSRFALSELQRVAK